MQTHPINNTNQKVSFGLRFRFNIPEKKASEAIRDMERFLDSTKIEIPHCRLKKSQAEQSLDKGVNVVSFLNQNFFDVFVNEKISNKRKAMINIKNDSGELFDFFKKEIQPQFLVSAWSNILINNIWSFLDKVFS